MLPRTRLAISTYLPNFWTRLSLRKQPDEVRKAHIMGAIESFKVFGAGGVSTSAECIEWAKRVGLPVLLDLG